MQAWGFVVFILATVMISTADAKIYERCELAMKLQKAGLNGYRGYGIGDWLCMAHYESGYDTSFVDHNPDGSSEYGIFQLNSAWWCNNGVTPTENLCHMDCRDLLNRHILDDILCAKRVVSTQNGMRAWDSWNHHCAGHDLSEWIKGCSVHVKTDQRRIHP
ncbi:sperm acrosome-associated protein 5-like [Ochotona curzoniae]|uniref:sperm acrosome-associated protein 5-like n=1 Tax=Ochotona curzoniae TaxID=130825 RepID=UPI001B34FAA9|nr:sperm acrosome-associated protein 5-like [Ochotona curzoniae]XP_040857709.1 sperm acrosome-associated protein 5-like [Ochotona curzoniae]